MSNKEYQGYIGKKVRVILKHPQTEIDGTFYVETETTIGIKNAYYKVFSRRYSNSEDEKHKKMTIPKNNLAFIVGK